MPSLLKIALIAPIFKITFPTSDSYRPTSIIPSFSKVINLHNGNMPQRSFKVHVHWLCLWPCLGLCIWDCC